jgi:hypothetical protein
MGLVDTELWEQKTPRQTTPSMGGCSMGTPGFAGERVKIFFSSETCTEALTADFHQYDKPTCVRQ